MKTSERFPRFRRSPERCRAGLVTTRLARAALWCVAVALGLGPATGRAQLFEDAAATWGIAGIAGPSGPGIGGGVAWFDADGDGDLDLAVGSPAALPRLFLQQNGSLVESPDAIVPDTPPLYTLGVLPFDMDGDGDLDLMMLRRGDNALLRNDGGTFTDVSERLPGDGLWSVSAAVGDIDGDGDDDVLVSNYISGISFPDHQCQRNSLLLNDGAGYFTEAAVDSGLTDLGCTLATALTDYDNDGDIDVVVANDFGQFGVPNLIYRNDGVDGEGRPVFVDVSISAGFDRRVYGMGIGTHDVNHDGWLDYYVTSIGRQILLLGGPDGTFVDALDEYGLGVILADEGFQVTWTPAFEDLDGDGWMDLFVTGGHIPSAAFINNGKVVPNLLFAGTPGAPWEDGPNDWWMPTHSDNRGRGVSIGDVDDDGRTDLAISHANGLITIYRSLSAQKALRLTLVPRFTGPSATGARVQGTCAGVVRERELTGGGTFASRHDGVLRLTFPEPCTEGSPVELIIRWPSGHVQRATATAGGAKTLTEPEWLAVGDGSLTLSPNGPDGLNLPNETPILVLVDGGSAATPTPTGGGTWATTWTADPGVDQVRFRLVVDGHELSARPTRRVGGGHINIRSRRQRLTPHTSWELLLVPRDAANLPIGPGLTVNATVEGESVALTDQGDGSYRSAALDTGDHTTLAVSASVPALGLSSDRTFVVEPVFDVSQSQLKFGHLQFPEEMITTTPFRVVVLLRDANGVGVETVGVEFVLTANGVPLTPIQVVNDQDEALLAYMGADIPDGAELLLTANGTAFGPPQTFHIVTSVADFLDDVDPEVSHCGGSMSWMMADGVDQVTLLAFMRDAKRNPMPIFDQAPTLELSHGLTVVPGSETSTDERFQWVIRAGTEPGPATVNVLLDGQPTGITCTINMLAAPENPPDLSEPLSEIELVPELLPIGGAPSIVSIWPRTKNGRLAGSGLGLTLTTDLGTVTTTPVYKGIGRYEATFISGNAPGVATITATSNDPDWLITAEVIIYDPQAPADPGPEMNEADTADTGDSQQDVAEPDAMLPDGLAPETIDSEVLDSEVLDSEVLDSEVLDSEVTDSEVTDTGDAGDVQDVPSPDTDAPDTSQPDSDAMGSDPDDGPTSSDTDEPGTDASGADAGADVSADASTETPGTAAPPGDGGCTASPASNGAGPIVFVLMLVLLGLIRRTGPRGTGVRE